MRASPISIELPKMSLLERQLYKKKLQAELAKLRVRGDEIKAALKAIRDLEEIVGFLTINEFLTAGLIELTAVQKSRLGERLQKGVNEGNWEQGQKTVATNTKARLARLPTYAPKVIERVLDGLKT